MQAIVRDALSHKQVTSRHNDKEVTREAWGWKFDPQWPHKQKSHDLWEFASGFLSY
jgi:hypothetical protein